MTWEKLVISDRDMIVENIVVDPESASHHFMVYGRYALPSDDEGIIDEHSYVDQAFLVYLDFSYLHEPMCQGVDNAGSESSATPTPRR